MRIALDRPLKVSYLLFLVLLGFTGWMHLTTALVATLFAYLALEVLSFGRLRWLAVSLFLVLLAGLFYGFGYFIKHAIVALPEIVQTSVPVIVRYADQRGIDLPFNDVGSLKNVVLDSVRYLGDFAKIATKESLFIIIGVAVAIGIFLNPEIDYDRKPQALNVFSLYCAHISRLFSSFFNSFRTVMGAQVIISAVNTVLTAIYVFSTSMPYAPVVTVVTFLCGLLPVVGNIISNTVIVCIGFTVSPQFAAWALAFLITIHKLEYFLNSKIIGSRIRHPMWLTLIGLVVGERLFGISGIILAPVILNFIKVEASQFEVEVARKTPEDALPTIPSGQ